MGLFFKSAEELANEREWQELRNAEEKAQKLRIKQFRKIIISPGSQSEFERQFGYKTAMIDLGDSDKGLVYSFEEHGLFRFEGVDSMNPFRWYSLDTQKEIAESGIVAIVNATPVDRGRYGLPIKKDDSESQEKNK